MGHDGPAIALRGLAPIVKAEPPAGRLAVQHPRAVLAIVIGSGLAVGLAVAVAADPGEAAVRASEAAGFELGRLLRFMAAIKAAAALGALALVGWRLRFDAGPLMRTGYLSGAFAMAAAPGLMWSLTHVVAGAVLFHAGLVLVVGLACADRGNSWRGMIPGRGRTERC